MTKQLTFQWPQGGRSVKPVTSSEKLERGQSPAKKEPKWPIEKPWESGEAAKISAEETRSTKRTPPGAP